MAEQSRVARIVRVTFRVVAWLALVVFAPYACYAFLMLPGKIQELGELYRPEYELGTNLFFAAWREPSWDLRWHFMRRIIDMVLYALGSASVYGLCAIAKGSASRRAEACFWAIIAITGAGFAGHMRTTIGPTTDSAWIAAVLVIPLATSAVSFAGIVAALACRD